MKTGYFPYIRELPEPLAPYADMIADLRWTWSHEGDSVWEVMDPEIWEQTENPHAILQNISQTRLNELAGNPEFIQRLAVLAEAHKRYCQDGSWFQEIPNKENLSTIAYFSMEYGLGNALPLYAGGLGILAGDYLKAASDLGVPVVAVGLLYQEGYFRQILDTNGWQEEIYPYNDSSSLPIQPVQSESGAWLYVTLDFPGRSVRLRVWQAKIGRVILYLLDSNDPINSAVDRSITSKLYGGGQELRLLQEIALGIGGWRLLEALGLKVDICHLNEGHAAFVTLERARSFMMKNNISFQQALWATRAGNVFTTHTPVAAGFDIFDAKLLGKYAAIFADKVNVSGDDLGALGRKNPADRSEPFNMAYLAMRTCSGVNGVSQLHGKVSRQIFQVLFPRWSQNEIPVTHVSNGIHVPSWDSPWADKIWTRACGKSRWMGTSEGLSEAIRDLSDESLWAFRGQERADLVKRVRQRLRRQLGQRGVDSNNIAQANDVLDPNILTLGFARRFAEYKRPNLLLHDPLRLQKILSNIERPVQILIAGKAHPNDMVGKQLIQQWIKFIQRPEVRLHAVFLEDYDIALAQEMVQGVDVWINTPRRPWEACGTSGMKVLVNGGLNLSVLDGWWAEAFSEEVGWALGGEPGASQSVNDEKDAQQLYALLENEIIPGFYQRDANGIPRAWVERMRTSMSRLAPQFSTNRMVRDYVEKMYMPAAKCYQQRAMNHAELALVLLNWEQYLQHHWQEIHWGNLLCREQPGLLHFEVQVYLGSISPEDIQVQLFAEATPDSNDICRVMDCASDITGATNGFVYDCHMETRRPAAHFTPRIVAFHPQALVPIENPLILWWTS